MNNPYKIIELGNGVVVEFHNHTNRYYGDFHRVKISVIAKIPIIIDSLPIDLHGLAKSCDGSIDFKKDLEQMGVSSAQVDEVSASLVDSFIVSVSRYLENGSFAEGLLRSRKNGNMNSAGVRY